MSNRRRISVKEVGSAKYNRKDFEEPNFRKNPSINDHQKKRGLHSIMMGEGQPFETGKVKKAKHFDKIINQEINFNFKGPHVNEKLNAPSAPIFNIHKDSQNKQPSLNPFSPRTQLPLPHFHQNDSSYSSNYRQPDLQESRPTLSYGEKASDYSYTVKYPNRKKSQFSHLHSGTNNQIANTSQFSLPSLSVSLRPVVNSSSPSSSPITSSTNTYLQMSAVATLNSLSSTNPSNYRSSQLLPGLHSKVGLLDLVDDYKRGKDPKISNFETAEYLINEFQELEKNLGSIVSQLDSMAEPRR